MGDQEIKPRISVVIATYNRCDVIQTTLQKLAEQSVPADQFEVIVIDDGSSDATEAVMGALLDAFPFALRYARHENRGPGYTENRGILMANSDLVLLIADDIWATRDLLRRHLKAHEKNVDEKIAVLGKVVQAPELPDSVIHRKWDPFSYFRFSGKKEVEPMFFYACNISFKKQFMLEHGLFRERKGAAHEDVELGYRLGQKGLRILYNEDALAYHYHTETVEKMCRRAFERGMNFDLLTDTIPKAYILQQYKITTLETGLGHYLKMLPRTILRAGLFNSLTVQYIWLPLLNKAEENSLAAYCASALIYRGVNGFFLRSGYRALQQKQRGN